MSALLAVVSLGATALLSNAAALGSAYRSSSASGSAAIPDHLLDVLTPAPPILQTLTDTERTSSDMQVLPMFDSTPAEDEKRCRILKLPEDLQLVAEHQGWRRMTGAWYAHNNVKLGTWMQSHLSSSYDTVYIHSEVDRGLAVEVSLKTDDEMRFLYGWVVDSQAVPGLNIPLVDCDRRLLFVVRQRATELREMDIYAADGVLLATTLVDWNVERVQFVGTNGYLIATAESPAVFANISRDAMSRDPTKGDVLPYGVHFEVGGYEGASGLLDTEFHWVIASAVQMRALLYAENADLLGGIPPPSCMSVLAVFTWLSLAFAVLALAGAFVCVYRSVYPRETDDKVFLQKASAHAAKAWYPKVV